MSPDDPARILVLLRHGKSDWSGDEEDVDRPLVKRGRRQASEAGRWLAGHVRQIDLAVVSPAERSRATWEAVAAELRDPVPTQVEERVYAAPAGRLLEVVRELPDDVSTAVLVGHNPGLENLVVSLTDEHVAMKTSALAVLAVFGPWSTAGTSPAALTASGRPPGS